MLSYFGKVVLIVSVVGVVGKDGNLGIVGNDNPDGFFINDPIVPTVAAANVGFLIPDIIPSNPDGFGILTFGTTGMFTFVTAVVIGILGKDEEGTDTDGVLTLMVGTAGADTVGIFGSVNGILF